MSESHWSHYCSVGHDEVFTYLAACPYCHKPEPTTTKQDTHEVKITVEDAPKSLRDEFAMAALTGRLANYNGERYDSIAEVAYKCADAMMEARKERLA